MTRQSRPLPLIWSITMDIADLCNLPTDDLLTAYIRLCYERNLLPLDEDTSDIDARVDAAFTEIRRRQTDPAYAQGRPAAHVW